MAPRADRGARRVREAVRALLAAGVERGTIPGAVAAVARRGHLLALEAAGSAQVVPRRRSMTVGTVFDLASLTKPVATTTVVLQLWTDGGLDLDAPVARYLPRFAQAGKAAVTTRHLLSHTSGLPAWEMLYLPAPDPGVAAASDTRDSGGSRALREAAARARACRSIGGAVARICATPALVPPGTRIEYSDLGFIILGHMVERLAGQTLERYCRRRILLPLGMRMTRFAPPAAWRPRCAATEAGNAFEREKAAEQGLGRRFPWRRYLLCGEVHDGNAWYLGQGVAGHAGLFGTAADLARLGVAMLNGGILDGTRILSAEAVRQAAAVQTPGAGPPHRGLGWALGRWPYAGARASPAAYGHTGFTGTSMLVDPEQDLVIVLLTNRVHPSARNEAIQEFRPAFHDAVIEAADG